MNNTKNNVIAVKKWRKNLKKRMVEAFGNACGICGYSKENYALDFHHLNPKEKDFTFSRIRANPKSWDKIVIELRKCVLLCSNCHREVHAGTTKIPDNISRFNEEYTIYKKKDKKIDKNKCPVCGDLKPIKHKTCSQNCARIKNQKINWEDINLKELMKKHSNVVIGKMLGVSETTVRKHIIKNNLKRI